MKAIWKRKHRLQSYQSTYSPSEEVTLFNAKGRDLDELGALVGMVRREQSSERKYKETAIRHVVDAIDDGDMHNLIGAGWKRHLERLVGRIDNWGRVSEEARKRCIAWLASHGFPTSW